VLDLGQGRQLIALTRLRQSCVRCGTRGLRDARREVLAAHRQTVAKCHCTLDGVTEFAHIAGERVTPQRGVRLVSEHLDAAPGTSAELAEKSLSEQVQITAAVAQRRDVE